jgi:hypothetical protein
VNRKILKIRTIVSQDQLLVLQQYVNEISRVYEELTALITGSYTPSARYDNDVPESTNVPCVFDVVNKEELMETF